MEVVSHLSHNHLTSSKVSPSSCSRAKNSPQHPKIVHYPWSGVVCLGMLDPRPSKWALLFWQMLCKHRESRLLSIIQPLPSKLALLFDKRFARRKNLDSLVLKLILRTLTIFGSLGTSFVRSRWVGSKYENIFSLKKIVRVPQLGTFFKEQNFRKENEIFDCFKWKSSTLFIYLFIYSHRQTCAEAAPCPRRHVVGSQACSLLPSNAFWNVDF